MSHQTYDKLTEEAFHELEIVKAREDAQLDLKPIRDRNLVTQLLSKNFAEYVSIYKKLVVCYDQVVRPQERFILENMLETVMGRLVELKHDIVNHDAKNFQFYDDLMVDLKLIPNDFMLRIPAHIKQITEEQKQRGRQLDEMLEKIAFLKAHYEQGNKMGVTAACKVLQRHERARQGLLRAYFMKEIRVAEEKRLQRLKKGRPKYTREEGAVKIQAVVRGFLQRCRTKKLRTEELHFLEMQYMPKIHCDAAERAAVTANQRRKLIKKNTQLYSQALIDVEERVREQQGPLILEEIQNKVRDWIVSEKIVNGAFPEIPDEEDGGTIFLFEEPAPIESEDAGKKEEKKKDEKKDKKGDEVDGWKAIPSNFTGSLSADLNDLKTQWIERVNDPEFCWEPYDVEIIKSQKRDAVWKMMHLLADDVMRKELDRMIKTLESKGKKGKKSKKKKKKDKKGKKDKKKGKKDKDPFANRSDESLWEELVQQRIIIKPDKVKLSDFVGDYDYLACDTTKCEPSIALNGSFEQLMEAMYLYGILPLCSTVVHEIVPHTKGILLGGAAGSGKKMLVHAIANELNATMIDLSCDNLVGKYTGKKPTEKFMQMVFRVARAYEPAIILMRDAELGFMKKPPKKDPRDPKRLKKDLPKIMKTLIPGDRILIIGCTDEPWETDQKACNPVFQRFLSVPEPTYGTRRLLWRQFAEKINSTYLDEVGLCSLAKCTEGWSGGAIMAVCEAFAERNKKNLTSSDYLVAITAVEQLPEDIQEDVASWTTKTPLGKTLTALHTASEEDPKAKKK